jgi:Fic family protein
MVQINLPDWELIDKQQEIINKSRPFSQEMLGRTKDFYRTPIIWTSNSIEGYSYTEIETSVLLEYGLTAGGKPFKDACAVIGLSKAYDYMFSLLKSDVILEPDLLFLHSCLADSLHNNAESGTYRKFRIGIRGSNHVFPSPEEVPSLMKESIAKLDSRRGLVHPVSLGAEFHADIVDVHPFGDGNGRVARLAMNTVFIQYGFLPVTIHPEFSHKYYDTLKLTDRRVFEPFVNLIAGLMQETQAQFIKIFCVPEPDGAPRDDGPSFKP